MSTPFKGARWKMVAWSVLIVTLLLFGMGVLVYVRTTRSLMQNLDATLEASSAAAQVELNETGSTASSSGRAIVLDCST